MGFSTLVLPNAIVDNGITVNFIHRNSISEWQGERSKNC